MWFMQREAERVEKTIAELTTAKAALALEMEAQARLLASSELLDDHPELHWDQLAASATPQLGAAKSLLVRDRKFSHFRCVHCKTCQYSRLYIWLIPHQS